MVSAAWHELSLPRTERVSPEVQVLHILAKGLVVLNMRVAYNGTVWGEDFVLSDTSLIQQVSGFALTYIEVLCLSRQSFMQVIERRRSSCPQLGQIVRRYCVRIAVYRGILAEAHRRSLLQQRPWMAVVSLTLPENAFGRGVATAEAAKEAGNALLKAGDFAGAAAKYAEGVDLTEPLLEKDPTEVGEDLQKRGAPQCDIRAAAPDENRSARTVQGTAVYVALRLNSAQANIKLSNWLQCIEHASKVLLIEKDPKLEDLRQQEKERLSAAMKGGLYQEQHKKLGKLQAAYEEEVKRLKEKGEAEISFEDRVQLEEVNQRRSGENLPPLSLEEWRAEMKASAEKKRREEVVKMDEAELDEEEWMRHMGRDKKLLKETKEKGYYHGRLGTVLSDAAPKPQLVTETEKEDSPKAGTWEEKDASSWAQERLSAWLSDACVSGSNVTLPAGSGEVTAKITKVKSIKGEAHIVYVRKQPRHGFHYEAELSFSMNLGEDKFSGTLSLPEIMDAMAPAELRVDARWKGSGGLSSLRRIA
eukprot:g13584.t1